MCLFSFDKICCPKFKLQKEKEKSFEESHNYLRVSVCSYKGACCALRANEAKVIDINILQGEEYSKCHIIREYVQVHYSKCGSPSTWTLWSIGSPSGRTRNKTILGCGKVENLVSREFTENGLYIYALVVCFLCYFNLH